MAGARLQELLHQRLVLAGFHHRHGTQITQHNNKRNLNQRRVHADQNYIKASGLFKKKTRQFKYLNECY